MPISEKNNSSVSYIKVDEGTFYCSSTNQRGNQIEGNLQGYYLVDDLGNPTARPPIPPGKRVVLKINDGETTFINKEKPDIHFSASLASRMKPVPDGAWVKITVKAGKDNSKVNFVQSVEYQNPNSEEWISVPYEEVPKDKALRTQMVLDTVEQHPANKKELSTVKS